jgi:hypothetical protein
MSSEGENFDSIGGTRWPEVAAMKSCETIAGQYGR